MPQDPSTQRPLGAQISHALRARGVDTIFGIPGVHNQEMYRGIEEAGIRHILARHEQGAAFMADGYARATGRLGVCYIITGPGLANAMTPLGQAYSDSVSVLAIASCLHETAARRGQLHQMRDQEGAARTVCAWSETAQSPDAAYGLVDRAFADAAARRKRSMALHVPIPLLEARAPEAPAPLTPPALPSADEASVADLRDLLSASRAPLIIAGGGAVKARVAELATVLGAATFTTYAGGGLVPEHPLDYGSYLARPSSADVIAQADLVIVLGSELAEVDLWRNALGHTAPMIRVDIDPEVLADEHRAEHPIFGDAAGVVDRMLTHLEGHRPNTKWQADEVAQTRTRWRSEVEAERPGIVAICDALRDVMPGDAMIYSDMTQFAYVAKEVWDMPRPGHWHHPSGFGTLGYALPAAIGGAVARTGLPTVAIAGDYGFQYTLQDLGTAVELAQPLPILIWDNMKLKEIEDSMVGAQIPPNAVIARNPDFMALARAYGAGARHPQSLEELQRDLTEAFDAPGPVVIYMTPDLTS